MPKVEYESKTTRGDLISEFKFLLDGKRYRVLPKPGKYDMMPKFLHFVQTVCPKRNLSPFQYPKCMEYFDIDRIGPSGVVEKKPSPHPEAEQLSLRLSSPMRVVEKYMAQEAGWNGPEAIQFYDAVSSQGIDPEEAKKVLDLAEKHGLMTKESAEMSYEEKTRDLVNRGYAVSMGEARRWCAVPGGYEKFIKLREKYVNRPIKVYLDDKRPTPPGWTRVYWPEDAIKLLEKGNVSEISLDHDLGDDEHGTGYDVIKWLEEAVATKGFKPPIIHVHTDNPSARQKMMMGVKSIERFSERAQPLDSK